MSNNQKHIIIIGAGFGGLHAAKELAKGNANYKITLFDKQNFHLFQPLLYQVATAQLSPEDILAGYSFFNNVYRAADTSYERS